MISPAKFLAAAAILAVLLWLLHPVSSSRLSREQGKVEIAFMAPGGPLSDAIADAVHVFEQESAAAHRKDPSAARTPRAIRQVIRRASSSASPVGCLRM